MKVKGFEKYRFILFIESLTPSGKKIGSLKKDIESVGRNYDQAYQEGLGMFREFLVNKLDELNIE